MKMPVLFVGHGSPVIALENNELTKNFKAVGDLIIKKFGRPKGIIAISAHWYTVGYFTCDEENPEQIYDMYGFPDELYQVKYEAKGSKDLANKIIEATEGKTRVNNGWGIDHGTWTVLVHMFPEADIPVVQLSVNGQDKIEEIYKVGQKLSSLREEGYLIIGSGNVVHNLRLVQWQNPAGTLEADGFDKYIKDAISNREDEKVLNYKENEFSTYAVPLPDHFLPLIYVLGASEGEDPYVFNEVRNLGSMSMTSYGFGL